MGIISQPDWKNKDSITVLGEPRLGFLVTAGNMDSMVNHYSVSKRRREKDSYTPGGVMGKRPDYATVVYCNLIRSVYKKAPIIIGGIEASLRRLAPVSYTHLDHLVIAVLHNSAKTPLFSVEERVKMLEEATKDIPNVEVKAFGGLTVEFARECGANALVRGLRAITDFEYELQIAQLNRVIAPDIDTVFLTTNLKYAYLSSSSVKEVAAYGGDISNFVTAGVAEEVHKKFQNKIRGKE